MALKSVRPTKVQRGISLPRDLYERIAVEADKYGRTWNETVELVLSRAFPAAGHDSRNTAVFSRHHGDDEYVRFAE